MPYEAGTDQLAASAFGSSQQSILYPLSGAAQGQSLSIQSDSSPNTAKLDVSAEGFVQDVPTIESSSRMAAETVDVSASQSSETGSTQLPGQPRQVRQIDQSEPVQAQQGQTPLMAMDWSSYTAMMLAPALPRSPDAIPGHVDLWAQVDAWMQLQPALGLTDAQDGVAQADTPMQFAPGLSRWGAGSLQPAPGRIENVTELNLAQIA